MDKEASNSIWPEIQFPPPRAQIPSDLPLGCRAQHKRPLAATRRSQFACAAIPKWPSLVFGGKTLNATQVLSRRSSHLSQWRLNCAAWERQAGFRLVSACAHNLRSGRIKRPRRAEEQLARSLQMSRALSGMVGGRRLRGASASLGALPVVGSWARAEEVVSEGGA